MSKPLKQFQKEYEQIERAVENGTMSWRTGMARTAMVAIEFARAEQRAADAETESALKMVTG